jgi:acetyl esterase/lipase
MRTSIEFLAWAIVSAAIVRGQVPVAANVITEDRFPVPKATFPGGVTGLADVVFARPNGFRPVKLDLYLPPAGAPKPFVIYVHGGGWSGGSPRNSAAFEDWPGVLASLAARGYVVASLDYRLSGEAPFPAAEQDVKASIRWLRANAEKYGIDPQRGLIWGASAGGHLAALAATSCGVAALEPEVGRGGRGRTPAPTESQPSDCVQAWVTWYGIFDMLPLTERPAGNPSSGPLKFLGCTASGCAAETVRLASAVSFVGARTPPALLIHGTEDKTVNPDQSRRMHELLTSKGVSSQLMLIPGVDHSFIGGSHEATSAASNAALQRTFAFIDATVGGKTAAVKR